MNDSELLLVYEIKYLAHLVPKVVWYDTSSNSLPHELQPSQSNIELHQCLNGITHSI
jgi:hypothetical protein